jgi:hypothetical protein
MKRKLLFFLMSSFLLLSGTTKAAEYYVKVTATGDGSGTSWDNAMSGETFISKLASDIVADDVIYMAGGIYKAQAGTTSYFVTIDKAITIIGGFASGITGSTVDITYPSSTPTVFSGDLNDNGIADSGDNPVVKIDNGSGEITLKGIRVTGGYSTSANRPGIHIAKGTVNLYYCTIDGNISAATANNDAGGAGIYSNGATVYAFKSSISNNSSANRGGAIRLAGSSVLTLESCLVTGNSISGDYGGAIQGSGSAPKIYCINTTVAYNTGNHGAGINAAGETYLISSTVVNNTAPSDDSQGQDIRYESDKMYVINSIITGSNEGAPHIYLNGNNRKIISEGHNVFGNVGKSATASVFETQESDRTTSYHSDIFGDNALADNDGYPQTIALNNFLQGSTIEELGAFKTTYQITAGDVAKDQRGFSRNTEGAVSIGAYEYPSIVLSTDATLQQLEVSQGTLTPDFAANIFIYTVDVAYEVETIDVTGTATDANAVVTGNVTGKSLEVGENTVIITVTAEDNLHTNDYVVTINREQPLSTDATLQQLEVSQGTLTPDFAANIFIYTVDVAYEVETIDVTGTATDANAVVTGNVTGKSLEVGENTVTITVTAEDNLHTNDYVVTVNRANPTSISNLTGSTAYEIITHANSLEIKTNKQGKLSVYDLLGKTIFDKSVETGNNYTVPALTSSIYLVKFNNEVKKVIVR